MNDPKITAPDPRRGMTSSSAAEVIKEAAYLPGDNLPGAILDGARLNGIELIGDRPLIQIGPIGPRSDYLVGYLTTEGVKLRTGCFFGSPKEFRARFDDNYPDKHRREYEAALVLIDAHAREWGGEGAKL